MSLPCSGDLDSWRFRAGDSVVMFSMAPMSFSEGDRDRCIPVLAGRFRFSGLHKPSQPITERRIMCSKSTKVDANGG